MSYASKRKLQREEDQTVDAADHSWEVEHCPLLHDGLSTASENDPNKSMLALSFFFQQGKYKFRLEDRENHEKAFGTLPTLADAFLVIESRIVANDLEWTPLADYSKSRNGSRFA